MKLLKLLLSFSFMISLTSCNQNQSEVKSNSEGYSFFIAGHSSGFRWVDNRGLHPPFEEKFDLINERNTAFGVLLGDIVFESKEQDWQEVDSVLQKLNCTTYFAVGNHDITNRELFEKRYGKTYFSFEQGQDLCIILDPNIDNWNISGQQLQFLKNVLSEKSRHARNIFAFFHQILWWDKDNKYRSVKVNSKKGRAESINFFSEVVPLFKKTGKPVYMFAGDLGAHWTKNYFYDTYEDITFVATGIGNDTEDNFIYVDVNREGKVSFEIISLMNNSNSFDELEEYRFSE